MRRIPLPHALRILNPPNLSRGFNQLTINCRHHLVKLHRDIAPHVQHTQKGGRAVILEYGNSLFLCNINDMLRNRAVTGSDHHR